MSNLIYGEKPQFSAPTCHICSGVRHTSFETYSDRLADFNGNVITIAARKREK